MKLHEQAIYYKALAAAQEARIADLFAYVSSGKFAVDNQCNTSDIILRIREGERDILTEFGA